MTKKGRQKLTSTIQITVTLRSIPMFHMNIIGIGRIQTVQSGGNYELKYINGLH